MPEWHPHLASIHDPLWQRMGAAPDCDAVLVDPSRNRSRMFCDTGNCGNRRHVAAYRERRASDERLREDQAKEEG
jgi:predicted RNA-binding Zn ribbon-like protein